MQRILVSRVLAGLALAVSLVLLGTPVPAGAGAPTDRLRGFFTRINAVLTDPATEEQPLERVARIRRIVADFTDIPSAAAEALGTEWAARTTAEREEFIDLFADLVERAYVGRLAGAVRVAGVVSPTYIDEVIEGDRAAVKTALRGTSGDVEYRMTMRGERWLIRDVVLDGVSVVDNYRAQFKRLLQHESYPALVAAMRRKLTGESMFFASLPPRAPRAAATPRPERDVVAAAPTPPAEPKPSKVVTPLPEPFVRYAVLKTRVSAPSSAASVVRPAAPLAVATSISSAPSPVPAAPAPGPATVESSVVTMFGALFFASVVLSGAAYLRRR